MKADIRLYDSYLEVRGGCPGLSKKLRFWRRTIGISDRTYRKEVTGEFEDLFSVSREDDGTFVLTTMPGFAHKVFEHCRENGIEFSFEDRRSPFPEPDPDALEGLRDYQVDAVGAAVDAGGGIIKAATGAGKTVMAQALIKVFPRRELIARGTPTCVFACPDKDINRKNWESLQKWLPDRDVGIIMSGAHRPSDDVVCCTIDSLDNIDPESVGVFICDEMHTASSSSRSQKIMKFTRARKWGVSATPSGRFDGGDLVAEGLFGPVVVDLSYQKMVELGALVPIHVYWIDCPDPHGGLSHYASLSTRDGKVRAGSVLNEGMNQLAADILMCMPDSMQTLCMVQYLEHMDGILRALPDDSGVVYVHGETSQDNLSGLRKVQAIKPKERKSIYSQMANGEIRKALSSMVWKQGVDFVDLQVVVNAAGGGSDIVAKQIPGRASRISDDKTEAFVIDFHHPWDTDDPFARDGKGHAGPLLSADRQRRRAYNNLGFKQTWIHNIKELPFLDPAKVAECQSAMPPRPVGLRR